VGQWLERWLAARSAPRPSTLRGYAAHVRLLYLAPCLGQILLADLSAAHVQAMFTAISRQHAAAGTSISPATLARVKATLRAALNAAIRVDHITANPASGAVLTSGLSLAHPARQIGRQRHQETADADQHHDTTANIAHTLANLCPYREPSTRFQSGEKPGQGRWGARGSNPEPTD
jgi:hypothetical protein